MHVGHTWRQLMVSRTLVAAHEAYHLWRHLKSGGRHRADLALFVIGDVQEYGMLNFRLSQTRRAVAKIRSRCLSQQHTGSDFVSANSLSSPTSEPRIAYWQRSAVEIRSARVHCFFLSTSYCPLIHNSYLDTQYPQPSSHKSCSEFNPAASSPGETFD